MTRTTVVRLFTGSLIGLAAGAVMLGMAVAVAFANDVFVMAGPDVAGLRPGVWTGVFIAMAGLAVLIVAAVAVTLLVAWVGAVVNTAYLENKTWFVVELVLGLLGFVFIAVLAYVVAGPDGMPRRELTGSGPMADGHADQRPETSSRPASFSGTR